jgi:mono/diheme cytochrome c family protein
MRMKPRFLALAAVFVLTGCGVNYPRDYPLAEYKRSDLLGPQDTADPVELPSEVEYQIGEILFKNFGEPFSPYMPSADAATNDQIFAGSRLYQVHCIHCHGMAGGGDGPTAPFLFPRPRDYRRGTFKWKSTVRNDKPTFADLYAILQNGAIGSSMPPFRLMPSQDLNDLVQYVIFLSKRGELERRLMQFYLSQGYSEEEVSKPETMVEIKQALADTATAGESVVEPEGTFPELQEGTTEFEDSLVRGKKLYLSEKAACYKCHGPDGQADPNKMAEEEKKKMFDDWGNPNYPRNLHLGMFRGGRRPADLYRRIHQGIAGASMPEGGKNLKPEEIWDLVRFVKAVPYRPDLLPIETKTASHGHDHGTEGHSETPEAAAKPAEGQGH